MGAGGGSCNAGCSGAALELSALAGVTLDAAPRRPLAMLEAPNKMKQPAITVSPRFRLTRPVRRKKPTVATAITANAVARLPSRVAWTHSDAATNTLGSLGYIANPDACGGIIRQS